VSRWTRFPVRAAAVFALLLACACGVDRRVDKADAALRAGDLAAAEAGYRWALEREPEHVAALYGLGWVYLQDGDSLRARDYFKRCSRVAPDDYRCHKGLGSVALSQNLLSQAETSLQDALKRAAEPADKAAVLNSLGLLRSNSGRTEEAISMFEEAIALEPDRGEYRFNLAEGLRTLKRYEDALRTVDDALELHIKEVRFRAMLLILRADILVFMTVNRLDAENCDETLPPVLAYLERADRALEQAEALGVEVPQLYAIRRKVHTRRSYITQDCASSG